MTKASSARRVIATRTTFNLRIKPEERQLIDRAAKASGKTRTAFILDAARMVAETALLDQALMTVKPGAYDAFVRQLDRPAHPSPRFDSWA